MHWTEEFDRDGLSIIPSIALQAECDQLIEKIARTDVRRSKAGIRHALKYPEISALAHNPEIMAAAAAVLGPAAFPFRATLFDKSPDSNWLVVWHQDTALPLTERRETEGWRSWSIKDGVIYAHAPAASLAQILALRIHLDDSTTENGALRVLRGTHNRGVLSDEEVHDCATNLAPTNCEVPRGGILAMRPLIVHSSPKSRSNIPRRVLHIEFAASRDIGDGLQLATA